MCQSLFKARNADLPSENRDYSELAIAMEAATTLEFGRLKSNRKEGRLCSGGKKGCF